MQLESYIKQNYQQHQQSTILVAISGGVDSVVLAFLLQKSGFNIALAHVNFQLRGAESDADQQFVEQFANQYQLPLHTTKFDTQNYAQNNNLSIQLAARELRYLWFAELQKKYDYQYLATAHHLNDDVETFLINMVRGTGIDGLLGIKESTRVIRPLLSFTKQELIAYAQKNQLSWREDSSNASDKYIRNRIRQQVVPVLESINPQFLQTFLQTKKNLQQTNDLLNTAVEDFKKKAVIFRENDKVEIDIALLKTHQHTEAILYQLLREYNFSAWDDIVLLLDASSGKQIFSNTHILLKDREKLIVKTILVANSKDNYKITIDKKVISEPISLTLDIFEGKFIATDKNEIVVDASLLTFPLQLRKWENGDFFYPLGMQGKKKISKFFKDEKFSVFQKQEIWLLTDSQNQVVWVVGHRMDQRYAVTSSTKKQLKIKYILE